MKRRKSSVQEENLEGTVMEGGSGRAESGRGTGRRWRKKDRRGRK